MVLESPTEGLPGTGELVDGRYRLLERAGTGGMADVFRAEDTALNRVVAVKLVRGTTDDEAVRQRARSEVALLASLSHHSLVTLYDAVVSDDGPSYLVMEYVEGSTLAQLIAEGPVAPDEVAAIGSDLAEGLHAVHTAGIVHRDVKPANVLLSPSAVPGRAFRVKLADFGIAYLLHSTRVTTPGLIIGTAAYLSPEQVRGEAPASPADIYALGLVLREALTGERAFSGAVGYEELVARLTTQPSLPASLGRRWQTLLAAMLAPDPADRPTAMEVATAAASLRGTKPTAVDAVPPPLPVAAAAVAAHAAERSSALPSAAEPPSPAEPPFPAEPPLTVAAPMAGATALASEAPTLLLPQPEAPASAPAAATTGAGRRRRWLIAVLAGAAAAIAVVVALTLSTTSLPGPGPSPAVSTLVEPSPTPPVETPAPTETPAVDDGDDAEEGGNDNSGPGNNNGNGNGNSGNGNSGNGNGNGNGNSGGDD